MSFFKNRAGESLFRIKALNGYLKYLAELEDSNGGSSDNPTLDGISNKMSLKYIVVQKDTIINRVAVKYKTREEIL